MTRHYDRRVEQATNQLARAVADREALRDSHRPSQAGHAGWLRIQHWHRLAHAHRMHLHWWYLLTPDAAVCTCGLLVDRPPSEVQSVAGHRHPQTWRPISLLVIPVPVYRTELSPLEAAPLRRPNAKPQYRAVCQACGYASPHLPLSEVAHARTAHRLGPCSTRPSEELHD